MATADYIDSKRSRKQRSSPRRKKKSHAFRNTLLVVLCLLLAVTYFAPAIVAATSLRNWLLQKALDPDGTVTLASASLGWFSPVQADGLDVRDAAGDAAVSIDSLRSEKSLIAMLLDVDDLGTLHIERPTVHLVAYEKDTNLERIFAHLLASEGESSITATLEVTEGTLVLDDTVARRQFTASDLAINGALGDATSGIVLAASGALAVDEQSGNFKVDLRATPSATTGEALAAGRVKCQTDALPLELLDPLLRRTIDGAQLTGRLTADLDGGWGSMATGGEASLEGNITLDQLAFAADALGDDQFRLDRVNMPCRIRQQGEQLQIDQLAIDCELGQITLSGSAKTSDFSTPDVLAALAHENYELKGHVDLARLAKMLPDSLRIRQGTEITSGQIQLVASSRLQPSGMSWTGLVETSQLAATAGGRPFAWDNPLAVQFALHEARNEIVIDRAVCTSSFLQVNAAGSLDNMNASADFDLARLVTELRQFCSLDDVQLAGQGHARMTLKRAAQDRLSADVDFQARGFQWITPGARPWTEDNLVVRATLDAQMDGTAVQRVDAAKLTVTSGSDQLEAQLRGAIADPIRGAWPIACSWRGQLAPWAARLESCLGLSGWDLGGSGTLQAVLTASSKAIDVENAQFQIAQLHAHTGEWFVDEPAVSSTLKGKWDVGANRVNLTAAKISAGTAIAVVDQAVLQATEGGWTLDGGNAHLEAELSQLVAWRQNPGTRPSLHVSGKLSGDARLKHADGATSGELDAVVDELRIVDAARPATPTTAPAAWQERRLTLAARGDYRHAEHQLKLDTLQVASDALRVDAGGTLATSDGGSVDVKGTVAYDWAQLAPLWRPYLGQGFQIAGRQTRQFAVAGRLTGPPTSADSWKNVGGQAAVGWTAMNAYGLRVGQGDLAAKLADGQLSTQPIDVEISEGRLTISPVARLTPSPAELFLPQGPLLTNVRLSPQLCSQGLRFVAPLLADATVAEGHFSVSLDGGQIPLTDPGEADVGGRMAIKGQIKPGPMASEFVGVIKELVTILRRGKLPNSGQLDGSLMSVDSSNVEFRMVNRRVYHRGLTLIVGTTPVTTEGSVGLDESLSLVAEVPINARLLGQDLSLGALEGRKLKIPISGTLSKPQLDRKALRDIPLQLIEDTTRDILIDGLNKGFERLFPPQQ